MLEEIDVNIWVAEQPLKYFGLGIRTRMTVIRLVSGELVVISPIELYESTVQELNQLGEVRHIIAPNLYHYMFAAAFKERYSDAVFWAVPGLKEKKPSLPIDKTVSQDEMSFSNELLHVCFDGFRTLLPTGPEPLNEYIFFHTATRTLIITDAAFNFDQTFPWTTQLIARASGIYDTLAPSILEKIATKEREKVGEAVERVLTWDFDRVIMAHGSIIKSGGKAAFSEAYRFVR